MGVMTRPEASTEALILRSWPCGETSTVTSLLTRDHGYVKVIAKGARGERSRLRPLIEPGRLVTVEFSLDPHRELQFLRGGEVDLDPMSDGATLERSAFLLGALELVDRCRPFGVGGSDEAGPSAGELFDVCGRFVRMLSSPSCSRPALLFFAFEWELLARHGMAPEVSACISCGRDHAELETSSLRFSAAEGGVVCGTCSRGDGVNEGRPLGAEAFGHLRDMAHTGIALNETSGDGTALARPIRRELGALLHGFLGYHMPGYRLPAALELLRAGKENTG